MVFMHPDQNGDFRNLENLEFIQEILNSNAHISAIVNSQKRVILSNEHMVNIAGLQSLERIIGNRPGEILNCINVSDGSECTTTDSCRFCGINRAIQDSQNRNIQTSIESRISTRINGRLISYDFRVTCTPLLFHNEPYTLVHLVDISSEKRNEMLEKVFFHDLLNRLGGFDGIVKIMKSENNQPELEEYIDLLNTIGEMTIDDILTQRTLRAAENENLILTIREHSAFEIMESVRKQLSFHPAVQSRHIVICADCVDFRLNTDGALLKRILLNMIKNAAEATPVNGTIELICEKKPVTALFSVRNTGVIPEDVQKQIFLRSFSTKGSGRGLGTYSMKLFGENYLKGKVYFSSDDEHGTLFTIELPS